MIMIARSLTVMSTSLFIVSLCSVIFLSFMLLFGVDSLCCGGWVCCA